ncbi:MAG: hypothetical protein MR451_08035 [Clostridiales bacterium]|nr:hypothetical protein [Clostridiales bacterium]
MNWNGRTADAPDWKRFHPPALSALPASENLFAGNRSFSNFVKKITDDFAKIIEKYEVFLNLTIQSIERRPPGGVFCKNLSICAQIAAKRWFDILFRPVYHNI